MLSGWLHGDQRNRALSAEPDLWRRLSVGQVPRLLSNTLALVGTVVASTCVIGTLTAWLVERTDLPGRTLWRWLLALPLAIPGYVAAVCAMFLFRRGGFVDQVAMQYLGFERHAFPLPPLFTLGGVTVIMALYTFPFIFLAVSAALRLLDTTLDDVARVAGRGPWHIFCTLTVPLLLPARKLMRIALREARQANQVEQFRDPLAALRPRLAGERKGDIVAYVKCGNSA